MKNMLWNPWHGCHKCSPGCLNCYVYYLDGLRGRDAGNVTRSKTNFGLPLKKDRQGNFKISSGSSLATCFTSDFFIEEADGWRDEAWCIINARKDVKFLICTKRIERFQRCIPEDWGEGYSNVTIAVTCETQEKADERLPVLCEIKSKHKQIFISPILEYVNCTAFLKSGEIELVSVGGESYKNARSCDFDWVRQIKRDCDEYKVAFSFHQTGANFVKDGKRYNLKHRQEYEQAKKAMEFLKNEKKR